ncbi:ankyrin repeat domain-containing protein [Fusarium pseudoanthophilum]|uniref:Ankyrin repeat domain-containing protein n=1 Tax=Fusarium pseudoanthophilum TaxID=48495 RepID=A0A8H5KEN5_9HYPO|nr:ankyrin repeat domain-containing protein [Fusarium pseudoanthophilum]
MRPGARPGLCRYSSITLSKYEPKSFQRSDEDEALLKELYSRDESDWSQSDLKSFEDIMDRDGAREDAAREPLRREIEDYFKDLALPSLPRPLPPSSLWLARTQATNCPYPAIKPFMVACDAGLLDQVKSWVEDHRRRDVLQQISMQDGLVFAARANRVDIVRYLLEEGGASLTGDVVREACDNLSLPLFEVCFQHGYHPNQQIPSRSGGFGVAINRCITDIEITRFLLEHGADPNVAPFMDGRTSGWGEKATPPMDRTSGLALDRAIAESLTIVVQMLLEHGADPKYSRPLHGIVERLHSHPTPGAQLEWRPLMTMVLSYGADINAVTYSGGTALQRAVHRKNWDIVEFLIERGANPFTKCPASKEDSFDDASLGLEDQPWRRSQEVKEYLKRLTSGSKMEIGEEAPEEVRDNPLVQIIQKVRRREAGLAE